MKILVTGATGFVGRELTERLQKLTGSAVCAAVRSNSAELAPGIKLFVTGNSLADTNWTAALDNVDVIIHLAARVHVMRDASSDPLAAFRAVNVAGTLALARQAAAAGVRRFIFLSSIKVNGEETILGKPFRAEDMAAPQDPYAISKLEAELGLRQIAASSDMEIVIIRPPLVYGPGVKANFQAMMQWVRRGVPLPLGAIRNQRSLVALENLVDLIVTCLDHPAAANQIFLVSDGEDLSTTQLLRRLGLALGKPARLVPIPARLIQIGARMIGRPDVAKRLCGSLQIDLKKTRELLGWSPPYSVDSSFARTAGCFLKQFKR